MTARMSFAVCAIAIAGCGDSDRSFTLSLAAEGSQ